MLRNNRFGFAFPVVCLFSSLMQIVAAQAMPDTQATSTQATPNSQATSNQHAAARALQAPLSFEANQGQANRRAQFVARGMGYSLALSPSGMTLRVKNEKRLTNTDLRNKTARVSQAADVSMTLLSPNLTASMVGQDLQRGKTNYLLGNDRSRWVTNVANFGKVRYESVYPRTDLVFYGNQGRLEYDFRVKSGADARKIQFAIAGAKPRINEGGDLVLATPAGDISWRKPVAYQLVEGKKREVHAEYQVSDAKVSFAVGPYDHTKELVIDPPLVWGSFLGGSSFDTPGQVQVDAAGDLYISGTTQSGDFPTTSGAADRTPDGTYNCFITKFSPDGQSLIYSTLVGGTANQGGGSECGALALDSDRNAYITGGSGQSDFPFTSGSYHYVSTTHGGAFVCKLNPAGSDLTYCLGAVTAGPIAVDSEGATYVAGAWGYVPPAPYPFTPGAYHNEFDPGRYYISVIKYNPAGSAIDYAALIGSSSNQSASGIAVDAAGEATIAGTWYPNNNTLAYPVTAGEPNSTEPSAIVTKFNSTGTALVYSALLATGQGDDIVTDAAGNVTVVGIGGTGIPTTSNAYEPYFPSSGGGIHQAFLTQMNASGKITYSTYLGGNAPENSYEYAYAAALEGNSGIVDIIGSKVSDTFPITDKTYYTTGCGYLARLNPALSGTAGLLYSGCIATNIEPVSDFFPYAFGSVASNGEGKIYLTFDNVGPTAMNSYQPFSNFSSEPTSGNNPEEIWVGEMNFAEPPAPPSVIVALPPNGTDYTLPVQYVATATTTCSKGVASMGIYTSPGVLAYSTSGDKLNTTITFKAGIYDTVVQEWDNCGGSEKTPVSVRIEPGGVAVSSPANNSTVTSPVHFVATATSDCPEGFSGSVIYSAPGVQVYSTDYSQINANVTLSAGKYNIVVQAFDNCGQIFQTPLTITVQ